MTLCHIIKSGVKKPSAMLWRDTCIKWTLPDSYRYNVNVQKDKFMKELPFSELINVVNKHHNNNVTNMSGEVNIQANLCCHWGYWVVDKFYFWGNCGLENSRQLQSKRERWGGQVSEVQKGFWGKAWRASFRHILQDRLTIFILL